jgi:hypothetical protein
MDGVATIDQPRSVVEDGVASLRTQGYFLLRSVYEPEVVENARKLVEAWYVRSTASLTDDIPKLASDTPMVWNLQAKDPLFLEMLFASDALEAILIRMLNDPWYKAIPEDAPNYVLRNYVARSSAKFLPLHIDSFIPYDGPAVISMQCSIVLEDSTRENGCTLVVPGSHKSGTFATQDAIENAIPL